MQFNNLLSNNFDRVLNDFLKERVKYYIKEKEKISPNIVLKENFIFNLVDDCIRIYCSSLIEQKILPSFQELLQNPKALPNVLNFDMQKEIIVQVIERHAFWINGLNDRDRAILQSDDNCKTEICNDIIEELMINRHLGVISAGMSSVVYPPLSKIILIVNLLYSMYNDAIQKMKKDDKLNAVGNVFVRAIEQIKSCCLLTDKMLLTDSIAIWRSLFETELTLAVLVYQPESISKKYLKFMQFQNFEYYSDEHTEEKRKVKTELKNEIEIHNITKNKENEFIHYGWLMETTEYNSKNCKLNLKNGLLKIAENLTKCTKYKEYETASQISHSAYFARSLFPQDLMKYALNLLNTSLLNVFDHITYYLSKNPKGFNESNFNDLKFEIEKLQKIIEKVNS